MRKEWLKKELSNEEVLEIEKEHLYDVKDDHYITVHEKKLPFGTSYFTWREMKDQHFKNMGKIYEFDSGEKSFQQLAGRKGFCLVKSGFVTGWCIVTLMS